MKLAEWLMADFDNALIRISNMKGMHLSRQAAMNAIIAEFLKLNDLAGQIKRLTEGENWIGEQSVKRARAQSPTPSPTPPSKSKRSPRRS